MKQCHVLKQTSNEALQHRLHLVPTGSLPIHPDPFAYAAQLLNNLARFPHGPLIDKMDPTPLPPSGSRLLAGNPVVSPKYVKVSKVVARRVDEFMARGLRSITNL